MESYNSKVQPPPYPIVTERQLFEYVAAHLPEEIKKLPEKEQIEHVEHIVNRFRRHEAHDDNEKELHQQYCKTIRENYKFLHPHLIQLKSWKFEEAFVNAIKDGSEKALKSVVTEVQPGIFACNMLQKETCDQLLEEVANFENWCYLNKLKVKRPNSMNNYGAILDDFGFDQTLDDLMRIYVNPFSKLLYAHIGDTLDDHHGFIVEYKIGKDIRLDFHVDDSDVTLNLCLGRVFEAGDLYFGGVRCAHHQQTKPLKNESFTYSHKIGAGLFHLGKHRHAANAITSGERYNLILWCRSTEFRSKVQKLLGCPEWCGCYNWSQKNSTS